MAIGHQIQYAGFWISPTNYYFQVRTHITEVCDNPRLFGTSEKAVRSVFRHFEEPWGSEHKAREFVIRQLVLAGWIRTRDYGPDGLTMNLPTLGVANLARAHVFARRVYGRRPLNFSPLRLDAVEGKRHVEIADLQTGRVFPGGHIPAAELPCLHLAEDASAIPIVGIPRVNLVALL